MKKVLGFALTSAYFLITAGLSAVSVILLLSLLLPFSNGFFQAAFPPNMSFLPILKYISGFTVSVTFMSVYTFVIWFKNEEIEFSSKIAYSMVISVLLVSSIRFLGYFLPTKLFQQLSGFVIEIVYISPLILILGFSQKILLRDNFELMKDVGRFSKILDGVFYGWLIVPISALPALLIEFLIIAPYSGYRLVWNIWGLVLILLTLSAGYLLREMNVNSKSEAKEELVRELRHAVKKLKED